MFRKARIGKRFHLPAKWWFRKVGRNIDDEQLLHNFLPTMRKFLEKPLEGIYDRDGALPFGTYRATPVVPCSSIISDYMMSDEELLESPSCVFRSIVCSLIKKNHPYMKDIEKVAFSLNWDGFPIFGSVTRKDLIKWMYKNPRILHCCLQL